MTTTLPPSDSEPIQPSQVEGENGFPSLESNVEGFQDAADQFAEFDPNPINNEDDANFFDFPNDNDASISGSEVKGEHPPQIQAVQGEQHKLIVDIRSSTIEEIPRLHI